jgi:hypothetical protein
MNRIVVFALAVFLGLVACTAGSQEETRETATTERSPNGSLMPADRENRCSSKATASVNGEPRRVRIDVAPCRVRLGETPRTRLINIGRTEVGYGPGFKLERKVNGRWRWINRRQAFTLPLVNLEPGEKGESEPLAVYLGSAEPLELKPGLYRATKSLQLTPGERRPPTMEIQVSFRILKASSAAFYARN